MRVRYAKRGRLRFTSHRDFSRAFERALVRARIPMAYSSGFNPHPRISYAGASPTGAASEAEYLEIGLAERVEADSLAADLDDALPDGLDVLEVVEATPGSLAERLEVSRWRIDLPGQDLADVEPGVDAFLAATSVAVERMTKKGCGPSTAARPCWRCARRRTTRGRRSRSSCDTPSRPSGRTTCCPASASSGVSTCPGHPW